MLKPILGYLDPYFVTVMDDTMQLLRYLFRTKNQLTFPISGTGSAGMEAGFDNFLEPGDVAVIGVNGFFGERMVENALRCGAEVIPVTAEWGRIVESEAIEAALKAQKKVKLLGLIHGETSTGVANPVESLAQAARKHDLLVMVDTIASLGGEPYKMDAWDIDVTTCASQKALESPPGLGIIGINKRAWAAIDQKQSPRGWLTDLRVWRGYAEEMASFHPHPGTVPVNNVAALRESTRLILEEGLETRWSRHARIARVVRDGVRAMGLRVLADEETASRNLTVVLADGKFETRALAEFLKEHYGMHIGLGLLEWADKAVRAGHMGPNANLEVVVPFLAGLEQFLRQSGHPVERGSCLTGLE